MSGSYSESDSDSINSSEDKKDVKLFDLKTEPRAAPTEVLANPFSGGAGRLMPKPSFLQESEKIAGVKFDSSVFSNPFRYDSAFLHMSHTPIMSHSNTAPCFYLSHIGKLGQEQTMCFGIGYRFFIDIAK